MMGVGAWDQESRQGAQESRQGAQPDLPDDRDPEHYVRGAPEAAKLLGGVTPPRVHHLVAAGRLRSWTATLIYPGVRSKDAVYYRPELERLRKELGEDKRSSNVNHWSTGPNADAIRAKISASHQARKARRRLGERPQA